MGVLTGFDKDSQFLITHFIAFIYTDSLTNRKMFELKTYHFSLRQQETQLQKKKNLYSFVIIKPNEGNFKKSKAIAGFKT